VRKIYHINIVYFDLGQGEDYVYRGRNDFYGIHKNDMLKLSKHQKEKYFRINAGDIFPEYYILRVNDFDDVARDSLDEWIYYLKNDDVPEEFTAPGLSLVREKLVYDRLSPEEKRDYNQHKEDMRYEKNIIATSQGEERIRIREEVREELEEKDKIIGEQVTIIETQEKAIEEKDKALEEKDKENAKLREQLAEMERFYRNKQSE
jgi:hypothetical protein